VWSAVTTARVHTLRCTFHDSEASKEGDLPVLLDVDRTVVVVFGRSIIVGLGGRRVVRRAVHVGVDRGSGGLLPRLGGIVGARLGRVLDGCAVWLSLDRLGVGPGGSGRGRRLGGGLVVVAGEGQSDAGGRAVGGKARTGRRTGLPPDSRPLRRDGGGAWRWRRRRR
jgi:hypothetical protein